MHWASVTRGRLLGVDRPLFTNSLVLLLALVGGQVLSFAVQILIARLIGIASYGVYTYTFTWLSLLVRLAVVGGDRVLIRYLTEYRHTGQVGLAHGVVRWSSATALATSALVSLTFLVIGWGTMTAGTAEARGVVLIGALILPILVDAVLVESVLRSCDAHHAASLAGRVLVPLLNGLLFAVAALSVPRLIDARWAIALNGLASLIVVLSARAVARRRLPARDEPLDLRPRPAWRRASLAFGLNSLALYLTAQVDMLVLAWFWDETLLGIYGAVVRIVTVMSFATTAVLMIIQPMIVTAQARGGPGELQRLATLGTRLICLASCGIGLIVIVAAEPLLRLFGEQFVGGATALRLLTGGYLAANFVSLASALLNMTGHQRDATVVMLGGCLLTLALNLLLAPRHGIEGAAAATAAATFVWNCGLFLAAWRRLGILAFPFAPRRSGAGA